MDIVLHRSPGGIIQGFAHLFDLGGTVQVVQQGRHAVKADGAKKLLVMQAAVRLAEDGMPFMGYGTQFVV